MLTDIPEDQITEILREHEKQPEKREGQRLLAEELMRSTRSEEDLQKAKICADLLYGEHPTLTKEMLSQVIDELPLTRLSMEEMKNATLADYLVKLQFAESKSGTRFFALS